MTSDAQVTLRNAAGILVQRALHAGSGFVFAVLVPRIMGPDVYGRYSLLSSLSIWFVILSSLNLVDVIGRYVPELLLRGDRSRLRNLWADLCTVRLASAALASSAYLGLTAMWLRDLAVSALVLTAGMVFVRAIADLVFAAFVGFNQASRWQLGETLRQWLSIGLLLLGFYAGGLSGAVLGLLLTELVVLALGLYWLSPRLAWPGLHLDVRGSVPYLRLGILFFAADALNTALGASGETLVRALTADYAQSGYFGLAWRVFITVALAIPFLSMAFLPLLSTLHAQGQVKALRRWVERLLKYLLLGGTVASLAALLLAEAVVPVVLGAQYRSVATNLVWLTISLLPLAVGQVARSVSVLYVRPRTAVEAAVIQLLTFWLAGALLTRRFGGVGSSMAMLVTRTLYAGYFTWRMRSVLPYSLRQGAVVLGLGILCLPLLLLRSFGVPSLLLFAACLVAYSALLLITKVVTIGEVADLWRAIAARSGTPEHGAAS
jgi:O-antigen/teichoic acid export membrane protein